MEESDIIQSSISQLGQSQGERAAPELRSGFVGIDERTPERLLGFAQSFAPLVKFFRYDPAQKKLVARQGWSPFFVHGGAKPAELLASSDGKTPPQLALFLAFLELYEAPRAAANRIVDLHVDFYFRRVLRFERRGAVPDRAHILFELKKNAAPVRVLPSHQLSGKDEAGVARIYRPVREVVVNAAKVDSLRAVVFDEQGHGALRAAPVANSADGLGAPLPEADPRFAPFGHAQLPACRTGFAIASPVLRMREGTRTVTLSLALTSSSALPEPATLQGVLKVYITGEKGWLGPYALTVLPGSGKVQLSFTVPAAEKPVVDYSAAIHGHAFAASAPVVRILFEGPSSAFGYGDLMKLGLALTSAQASVNVTGVAGLTLESDAGTLDPKKPFLPFGSRPVQGSRFHVGYPEAQSKTLTKLSLDLEWHALPSSFASHYTGYGVTLDYTRFTATAALTDRAGTRPSQTVSLFASSGATKTIDLTPGSPSSGGAPPGAARPLLTMSLVNDFLHETYRTKTIENANAVATRALDIAANKNLNADNKIPAPLNEPYTPTLRGLTLTYSAQSANIDLSEKTKTAFDSSDDIRFFHVDAFGERREHGWLRNPAPNTAKAPLPLLPPHPDTPPGVSPSGSPTQKSEFFIGLTGVAAGDSVSVLFQVAEGSADPDVSPPPIAWSVLCGNYWKALGSDHIAVDTTNHLLRSGVVALVLPKEVTTDNTLLPAGRVWLKAAVTRDAAATSQLLAVQANAVEVKLELPGGDPPALDKPLPALTLSKLKTPLPPVKSVRQPYASFGGRPVESPDAMVTRASERLRHKNRCITPWDYERIVLEEFPRVHKVKCVPHATHEGQWLAPGHVLLVVVPDLRNDNARDPLKPRVDTDTLTAIQAYAQARAGMQVKVHVKNPAYQKLRLGFKVRFHTGFEPNLYRQVLKQELTAFLSPWAFDATRPISFGGRVYRSVLLDFVEEREYVDYVSDFKMFSHEGSGPPFGDDLAEVQAWTPDAILVSDTDHDIVDIP